MTITGTVAQVNALLNTNATSTVTYVDSTDTPSATSTLTLSVNDNGNTGTGGALVSTATSTINITAVNDAPVATITPASYSNTEQVALNLKNNGLSIIGRRRRLLLDDGHAVGDRGHADASPPAPAAPSVTNSGTSSVTITGTVAQVNALLNTNATQHGHLRRQHRHAVGDVDADAVGERQRQHRHRRRLVSTATSTINITAVNDAPVATITPASYSNTEQVSLNLKNNGLSITDADAGSVVDDGDAGGDRGHADRHRRHQRRVGHRTAAPSSVTITGTVAQVNALLNTNADQHGQLRRQHRHAVGDVDADAVGATTTATPAPAATSSRPPRRPSTSRPSTTRRWRRSRRPATATPSRSSLNLKNNGLSISDADAGSSSMTVTLARHRGHADGDRRHQRRRWSPTRAPRR